MNPYEKLLRGFLQMCGGWFLVYSIIYMREGMDLIMRGQARVMDGLLQLGFKDW